MPNGWIDTFEDEEGEEYNASAFGGFSDYFRRKKIKLQNLDHELRSQATDKLQIFKGIVVHVNGYTQPSLNDLHKMIVQHGGGFIQYLDNKTMVTHIIASSLTPKKAVEFKRYRIVKPAWVVDSIKAGKLLPWDNYRVVDEGAGQRVLGFDNGRVISQASTQVRGYKEQTDASWYTDQLKSGTADSQSSNRFKLPSQNPPISDVGNEIRDGLSSSHQPQIGMDETERSANRINHRDVPPQSTLPHDSRSEEQALPTDAITGRDAPLTEEQVRLQGLRKLEAGGKLPEIEMVQAADLLDHMVEMESELMGETKEPPDADPDCTNSNMADSRVIKRPNDDNSALLSESTKMTAEEHNAILLADPRIRKSTAVNPDFIEQYYRESRLHHLSTWKADLKSQLQAMAAEKTASQSAKQKHLPGVRRYIMHVDFDSFFAAVSLKMRPEWKELPAVVAHGTGNGSEIASCNYPARKFGITNGMWMKRAQELCPQLKVLPYDFPGYEEASRAFYYAIITTGGVVQSVSIDEALVDISNLCIGAGGSDGIKRGEDSIFHEQKKAEDIAQKLRDEVRAKTQCEVSVGIGGNILQAKLALRKAKPAGQYQLKPEEVLEFIGELQVQSLPGVAWSIGGKLEELGIRFVKDIRGFPRERLINVLGPKTGERIWEYARGIDRKEVGDVEVRKSVSADITWGVRFVTQDQVDEFIGNLCGELNKRLIKERVKGKQLSLKVMRRAADAPLDPPKHLGHGKCDTYNKSTILGIATNDTNVLTKETLSMLKSFGFSPGELRGIGVQMTRLEQTKPNVESSQRQLPFKMPAPQSKEPDGQPKPKKPKEDQIEEIATPEKQKLPPEKIPFGAAELNQSTPSKKPLNTLGTQFILPTQVDPEVLAELPEDIKAKLAKHVGPVQSKSSSTDAGKNNAAPSLTALPNQSQLDPEILNSLPEDVRSEILAFYQHPPTKRHQISAQSILPQSPYRNRTLPPPKRPVAGPSRRGRPSKLSGRSHGNSTLTQSNFIATRLAKAREQDATTPPTTDTEGDEPAASKEADRPEEYDPDFLAALPEDIRLELLDDQRRRRLQKTSGLHLSRPSRPRKAPPKKAQDAEPGQQSIQRLLRLPPRPAKPTFTLKKLSSLPELRDAVWDWVREFRDEGPYAEDVEALGKYLRRVVREEGDMGKAVAAVKWLDWVLGEEFEDVVVGERTDGNGRARDRWMSALENVQVVVQSAVKEKGLGGVEF